jgi:hypothetical protein
VNIDDISTYKDLLTFAGYKVKTYKEFGDYQGTWIAEMEDGSFVQGRFGSCDMCDQLKGLLYSYDDDEDGEKSGEKSEIENLKSLNLKHFAKLLVENPVPKEEILSAANKDAEWDLESEEIIEFLEGK